MSGDLSRRLWEEHAEWWIDGFTDGADPEYEDQIEDEGLKEVGDEEWPQKRIVLDESGSLVV
ncbi:MAG: hypothetical protein ACPGR3_07400, partial [Ilumatobacteraceae bacterium]